MAVPADDALLAKCGRSEARAITVEQFFERGLKVRLAHMLGGEVAADDDVVHILKQGFNAGITVVEVGDDGDAGCAGPLGRKSAGCGIEPVDVEHAGRGNPFALQIFRMKDHSLVALTEHGAFAFIDHDEILQTACARDGDDLGVDTCVGEGFAVKAGAVVFAELADVARGQAPGLAGNDSGCGLTAGL